VVGYSAAFPWDFTLAIFGVPVVPQKHITVLNTKNFTMRRKIIYTIIFSFIVINASRGQNIGETYQFAEKQFSAGNFQAALIEYQRVVFFDKENKFTDVFLKIANSFYAVNNYKKAAENYDIAARAISNDSLSAEMYFKKSLCYFKLGNYFFALNELLGLQVPASNYFQNKHNLFIAIAWFGIGDQESSFQHLSRIVPTDKIPQLEKIFDHFKKIQKRFNPQKVQTMSTILPGFGQFYVGNVSSGLNSVILIGGIAAVTVYIWQTYGFLDAILSMSSWYYRYYSGGTKNAKKLAVEKIAHEKEETYNEIIQLVESSILIQK